MLEVLVFAAETADAAEEGEKVITWMLIVGVIFVSVIVLGDGLDALRKRRRRRRPADDVNAWRTTR